MGSTAPGAGVARANRPSPTHQGKNVGIRTTPLEETLAEGQAPFRPANAAHPGPAEEPRRAAGPGPKVRLRKCGAPVRAANVGARRGAPGKGRTATGPAVAAVVLLREVEPFLTVGSRRAAADGDRPRADHTPPHSATTLANAERLGVRSCRPRLVGLSACGMHRQGASLRARRVMGLEALVAGGDGSQGTGSPTIVGWRGIVARAPGKH